MTTTLDDIAIKYHTAEYVEKRIDDWEQRLTNLYLIIRYWLPDGWAATDGEPVAMYEKIMESAGVEQRNIHTLKIFNQAGDKINFAPKALWVIGANGRVDVKYNGQRYFICDYADNFEPPDWQVVNASNWRDVQPLSQEWLIYFLN